MVIVFKLNSKQSNPLASFFQVKHYFSNFKQYLKTKQICIIILNKTAEAAVFVQTAQLSLSVQLSCFQVFKDVVRIKLTTMVSDCTAYLL